MQAVKSVATQSYFLFAFNVESPLLILPEDKAILASSPALEGQINAASRRNSRSESREARQPAADKGQGEGPAPAPSRRSLFDVGDVAQAALDKQKQPDTSKPPKPSAPAMSMREPPKPKQSPPSGERSMATPAVVSRSRVNLKQTVDSSAVGSFIVFDLGHLKVRNSYLFPESQAGDGDGDQGDTCEGDACGPPAEPCFTLGLEMGGIQMRAYEAEAAKESTMMQKVDANIKLVSGRPGHSSRALAAAGSK